MQGKYFYVLASTALSFASPIGPGASCPMPHRPDPPTEPSLPQHGNGTNFPSPPSSLRLKYLALGFGIQNYTCESEGADGQLYGALAMFYDAMPLYPGQSPHSLSKEDFYGLPAKTVNNYKVPLNFNSSTADRIDASYLGADLESPFTAPTSLHISGLQPLSWLGHHFFTASGTPHFVLKDNEVLFWADILEKFDAPTDANPGPEGTGATTWLYLGQKKGHDSTGAEYVYRELTAGGAAHKCTMAGRESVPYSATYWFYG